MQVQGILKVYETGRRGRPVRTIQPGDLADPYGKTPWRRLVTLWSTLVDVVREARELEARLLGSAQYRYLDRS